MESLIFLWSEMSVLWQAASALAAAVPVALAAYLTLLKIQKTRIDIDTHNRENSQRKKVTGKKAGSPKNPSNYDLYKASAREFYRLKYQSSKIIEFEKKHLKIISKLLKTKSPNVLDAGCADGLIAVTRFSGDKTWGKITGIDNQGFLIKDARERTQKEMDKFSFMEFDLIELCNTKSNLRKAVGHPLHVIYSALTIHHLGTQNQLPVLRYLWGQLEESGVLYIRSFDDTLKISSPSHSHLLEELVSISAGVAGASDRHHGRKLFEQLLSLTGDQESIYSDHFVMDTCGMDEEERGSFFEYAYGFRIERIESALKQDPENAELESKLERAIDIVEEVKPLFVSDTKFYSASSELVMYAQKKSQQYNPHRVET